MAESHPRRPLGPLSAFPDLYQLFERHTGFYRPLCVAYADAAGICLGRHHESPTDFELVTDTSSCFRELSWLVPTIETKANWNNSDDAVRDGAYSVALAAVEVELGYVSLMRAEKKTGADYYVGPPGTDVENAFRLEVSGTEADGAEVEYRLKEKLKQLRAVSDDLGYACIIGFKVKRVALSSLEDQSHSE